MQSLTKTRKSSTDSTAEEMTSLSWMLFSIVAAFLFCSSFQLLGSLLLFLFNAKDNFFYLVVLSGRHFFDVLNSCVNMIFYCMFGKRFRAELSRLFRSKEKRKNNKRNAKCIEIQDFSSSSCSWTNCTTSSETIAI